MKVITNRNFGRTTIEHTKPEKPERKKIKIPTWAMVAAIALVILVFWAFRGKARPELGSVIYTHQGIPVYYNGDTIEQTHGNHYAADGYYYGQKWQCVEFVKRYLHDKHHHQFPNPYGNAAHFFKPELRSGQVNPDRNMVQYPNGGTEPPKANDVVVFADNLLGHVAIVSKVTKRKVEVVQQNILEKPTEIFDLEENRGHFTLKGSREAAGWLRLPTVR